jgi:PEP-CTERM motif
MRPFLISSLLITSFLAPSWALADEHIHAGDVQPSIVAGKITLLSGQSLAANGATLFEGDFGDLIKGPYKTTTPGFNTYDFAANTVVNYTAVGPVSFWDGLSWTSAVPRNEYVLLEGNLGEETKWTSSGPTGDLTGLLGQASADDHELHEHLAFSVASTLGGTPSVGAYMVGLQLSAAGYTSSDPFYLVFNRGLTSENFEASVSALTTPVPEPSSVMLMLTGLAVMGAMVGKRRLQA